MPNITPEQIQEEYNYYKETSRQKREVWTECWKNYVSHVDTADNPYLANLFIPKTHEAVTLMSAFLAGTNQKLNADPEGAGDTETAILVEKILDWQWRKELGGRDKVVTWIQQAILFGNGIMRVGWDYKKKTPYMYTCNMPDIYMDYFAKEMEDSQSVIYRVPKLVGQIQDDKTLNGTRNQVIPENVDVDEDEENQFGAYDNTIKAPRVGRTQKSVLFEHHSFKRWYGYYSWTNIYGMANP